MDDVVKPLFAAGVLKSEDEKASFVHDYLSVAQL